MPRVAPYLLLHVDFGFCLLVGSFPIELTRHGEIFGLGIVVFSRLFYLEQFILLSAIGVSFWYRLMVLWIEDLHFMMLVLALDGDLPFSLSRILLESVFSI